MLIELADAAATEALGARLAAALAERDNGACIALAGELGAGKTTLVRGVLGALDHPGPVVSPSYTLVEPYRLAGRALYHLDLYRVADPVELEFLGVRDIDPGADWVFVEWVERGAGFLPAIDLNVALAYAGAARRARLDAETDTGRRLLAGLAAG